MISSAYRFIYLHAPKTGGNSIQTVLLPYSDDHKVQKAHQDGVERFGIRGSRTRGKHMRLGEYSAALGEPFGDYRVVISVRHPFERALSMWFSPHRWMRQDREGGWILTQPQWDESEFLRFITTMRPQSAFLMVDGLIRRPDFVIRHETLAVDFDAFASGVGLPCRSTALPHVNVSAVSAETRARLFQDSRLRQAAKTVFADDMAMFGYR